MKKLMAVAAFSIQAVSPQSLGLGTSVTVDLTVQADASFQGAVDLSVDPAGLAAKDPEHDVSFKITPARVTLTPGGAAQAKLTIQTKTSAPDFQGINKVPDGGKFTLVAKSGGVTSPTDVALAVEAVYVVNVIQKREGKCADNSKVEDRVSWICDFDSPAETVYFRAHKGGLQVKIHNATTDKFFVHGSDAIQHMPTYATNGPAEPLAPGKDYEPPRIMDTPANLKGSYTLHEIYRPSRDAVFNAETIPAARPR